MLQKLRTYHLYQRVIQVCASWKIREREWSALLTSSYIQSNYIMIKESFNIELRCSHAPLTFRIWYRGEKTQVLHFARSYISYYCHSMSSLCLKIKNQNKIEIKNRNKSVRKNNFDFILIIFSIGKEISKLKITCYRWRCFRLRYIEHQIVFIILRNFICYYCLLLYMEIFLLQTYYGYYGFFKY